MSLFEFPIAVAAVALSLGYVARFAYNAGKADRVLERRLREELGENLSLLGRRIDALEAADIDRTRQLRELAEEYREVVGPKHEERITKLIQETAATKNTRKTWRDRYGLQPTDAER